MTLLDPDMPQQELRLHMGEITYDESLVARAAIRWANTKLSEHIFIEQEKINISGRSLDESNVYYAFRECTDFARENEDTSISICLDPDNYDTIRAILNDVLARFENERLTKCNHSTL